MNIQHTTKTNSVSNQVRHMKTDLFFLNFGMCIEGDVIAVIERRKDDWFKGNLNGKVGLFPGNYVEEI